MILVTGASGFVGNALLEVLAQSRRPVVEVARGLVAGSGFEEDERRYVSGDLHDAEVRRRCLEGVSSVIHLAGVAPGFSGTRADEEPALLKKLLGDLPEGIDRFVYLSATGAAADSSVSWLRAKGQAEELVRNSGLPWVILRAGPVFGAESPLLHGLASVLKSTTSLRLPFLCRGSLRPISKEDVAIALATSLDHHRVQGRTVEVGAAETYTLEELVRLLAQRLGVAPRVGRAPWSGPSLSDLLRGRAGAGMPHPEDWLRWFSVCEAPAVEEYDRILPMRRSRLSEDVRGYPWGAPPPKAGEPLPVLRQPQSGLPLFIPGKHLRDETDAKWPTLEELGRLDPFGRPGSPPRDEENGG